MPLPSFGDNRLESLALKLARMVGETEGHKTRSVRSTLLDTYVQTVQQEDSDSATAVVQWIRSELGADGGHLNAQDALHAFADFVWSHQDGEEQQVALIWTQLRRRVDDILMGTKQVQRKQHNIFEALTEDPEEYLFRKDPDGDDDDDSYDNNNGDDDDDDDDGRASLDALSWDVFTTSFDDRFGQGVKPAQWRDVVKLNHELWMLLCRQWTGILESAGNFRTQKDLSLDISKGLHQDVLGVLRRTRLIPRSMYSTALWVNVVKESRLASAILEWSTPGALASWTAPFAIELLRRHRIDITLLCVLFSWIPPDVLSGIMAASPSQVHPRVAKPRGGFLRRQSLTIGTEVLRALRKHSGVVPLSASPSSAFFLLGQHNFQDACAEWLFQALQARGYDATGLLNDHGQLQEAIYTGVVKNLNDNQKSSVQPVDGLVDVIFSRTLEYWDLKKSLKARVKGAKGLLGLPGRTSLKVPCQKCSGLDPAQQCVQTIFVTVDPANTDLRGCGVSVHPQEDVFKPSPARANEAHPKPTFHPQRDLGLKEIVCDEAIVARCGIQIFRLVERATGRLRDFWAYGVFPEDLRQKMLHHVETFAHLKGVERGSQFRNYVQGNMVALGARTPSGGAPGDAHRFPDVMSASEKGPLNCLFDNAEDSLILDEVSRFIAFEVYQELHSAGVGDEKIGVDNGGVLYYCENYAAPFHQDKDKVPGLCANLAYHADPGDYCFINMAYRDTNGDRFYFAPRTNSFWSFRGTDIHGTSLPSLKRKTRGGEGEGGGGGDDDNRYIYTVHKAKTTRNVNAAAKYAKVRAARNAVAEFWEDIQT